MLVAAFEIQIGRPGQLFALFQHRIMRRTRIEPYVHRIGQFVVVFAVFCIQQLAFIERKPCFNAFFFDALRDFFQQRGGIGVQFARFLMGEKGHRRTPKPLAGHHPVGAAFDHRLQARPAPCREKLGVVHSL